MKTINKYLWLVILSFITNGLVPQNFKSEPVFFESSDELEVISVVPTGTIKPNQLKEIYITFNYPIIPLGKREEIEKYKNYIPFTIKPLIKGNIHWYGTNTVALEIKDNVVPGQKYQIIIPDTLESTNGKKLKKTKFFSFHIEEFKIINIYPNLQEQIDLDTTIYMYLNYPLESVEKYISIHSAQKSFVLNKDYEIVKEDLASFGIKFNKPLPPKSIITIKLSKEAKIKDTNIKIGKDYEYKYTTKGPVDVKLINEAKFFQDYYNLSLEFSNPILLKENLQQILILDKNGKQVPLKENLDLDYPENRTYLTNWKIASDETYAIIVKKGLKDIFGTTLEETKSFRIKVPILRPDFYYKEGNYYYESCVTPKQNFYYSNILEINLRIASLKSKNLLEKNLENLIFKNQKIQITNKPNQKGFKAIEFQDYLEKNNNCYYGALAVELKGNYFDQYDNKYQTKSFLQTIQFTDIGLTVLQGPERIWYFAQSLSTGNFLQNLEIQLYSNTKVINRCITDDNGFCEINTKTENLQLASIGQYQKDKIVLKHDYSNRIYNYGVIEHSFDKPKIIGFVIFDRKLYRPGEIVFFKAYLHYSKLGKYYSINSNTSKFKVLILNSRGDEIYSKILSTNNYGTLQDSLSIPNDAPTGYYNIEILPIVFLNQNIKLNSIYSSFQVEEFRPLPFTANISTIKDQYSLRIPSFSIEGRYLFGSPLWNSKVELNFSYIPIIVDFKDGYSTKGLWNYIQESSELLLREVVNLNASGKYNFPEKAFKVKDKTFKYIRDYKMENNAIVKLNWENLELKENYKINLKVKIYDLLNRSITKFVNFNTYISKNIPGIKLTKWITEVNKEFSFILGNFDPETKHFSSHTSSFEIYIFKEEWNIIATKAGTDKVEKVKSYTPILKFNKKLSIKNKEEIIFTPTESGSYLILVKNSQGSYAEATFYVSGSGFAYWNEEQDNLKLIPNKEEYDLEEEASILIQSPYEKANALITIEGEDLYDQKVIKDIPSSYNYHFKMKKDYYPGIYVSVTIFKPRNKESKEALYQKDPSKPQIKTGLVYLEFSKNSKRISLSIGSNCNPCKPKDKIKIKFQTEPNAEIAVSIADRSVLDLIDYHYLDPISIMYPKRDYAIEMYDNRIALLDQFIELKKGDEAGGDQAESGGFDIDGDDGTRKNFKFTAYWNPTIIANEKGFAEIEFTLPDNITTFRIMAMATINGKFAKQEKEFAVQKELVIVPVLTNFIRIGEKIEIGGLIVNNSLSTQDFKMNLESKPNICVSSEKNIKLYSMQSASLLWECEYKPNLYKNKKNDFKTYLEDVEFILSAKSNQFSDKIIQKVPVRVQNYREGFTNSGIIQKEKEEKISIPDPEKNPGFIFINLSSSILSNYKNSLNYFELNPYLCLEQRASAFYIHTLARKYNINQEIYGVYAYENSKKLFLEELTEFINHDGGFKLWKESKTSNLFLTIYILDILYKLQENNVISLTYEPFSSIIKNSFDYINKELSNLNKYTEFYYTEALYYYFYVANLYQKPIQNEFNKSLNLYGNKHISFRSKGYIVLLLDKLKINSKYKEKFIKYFINSLKFTTRKIYLEEDLPYFSSRQAFYTNTSSITPWLEYFIKNSINIELISKIVQGLISRNINYTSSYEESQLAYTIDLYKTKFEKSQSTSLDIFFENNKLNSYSFKTGFSEYKEKFMFDEYKNLKSITMKNQNSDSLIYYSIFLDYQLTPDELTPINEGFSIKKEIYYYDEEKKSYIPLEHKNDVYELEVGKVYVTKLNIINIKPIQNFVIEDPISSLAEIVNLSFITENNKPTEDTIMELDFDYFSDDYSTEIYKDRYLIRGEYLSVGYHKFEFYIRPITKGKGLYLPTTAKGIYEPEIYGRSNSLKIIAK